VTGYIRIHIKFYLNILIVAFNVKIPEHFLDFQISQGSVATCCRWGGNYCGLWIENWTENFHANQLLKEFWKSVHFCQSYYQTPRVILLWDTEQEALHCRREAARCFLSVRS